MPHQPLTIPPHHIKKKIKLVILKLVIQKLLSFAGPPPSSTSLTSGNFETHIGLITRRCGNYKMVWMGLRLEIGGAKKPIG